MISLEKTFRSKVARRVFVLFVLCAMVPIVGLALVSLFQVRKQLAAQSEERLYENAKGKALAIFERLTFVDRELALLATNLDADESGYERWRDASQYRNRQERFRAIAVMTEEGVRTLQGEVSYRPELREDQLERTLEDRSIVGTHDDTNSIWMVRRLGAGALLLADIDAEYLWSVDDLPSMQELTVVRSSGHLLYSSLRSDAISSLAPGIRKRHFRWSDEAETYVSSAWELPLMFAFHSPPWFVVLSEPESSLMTPVTEFMKAFPLVMLLSFWVVLLLSVNQIRRSLDPLERLTNGTERIARRDFGTPVEVSSGDEFEELARSFNGMAQRLNQQFHTLTTMSEIDRAVLSTLETETIVERLHHRLYDILDANEVRITVLEDEPVSYVSRREDRAVTRRPIVNGSFDESDVRALMERPEGLPLPTGAAVPFFPGRNGEAAARILLPVPVKQELGAVLCLSYDSETALTEEERAQVRQLTDRFAVALSNARLLEDLDQLNWGSLVALARTIDAKSPWTAGHSERAAMIATAIGESLGLTKDELDIVHRGGLLHDIGKIGIPPEILDKKGKLTDEEREVMKEHPGIGARILEPIEAYRRYIPVVLQHHEWFDGSGYPGGLSGEAISLYARVYSVADVYDALFADRPYREGLQQVDVVSYIESRSGTQFDPRVVEAFLRLVEGEDPRLADRSRHVHRLTGAFAGSPAASNRNAE